MSFLAKNIYAIALNHLLSVYIEQITTNDIGGGSNLLVIVVI